MSKANGSAATALSRAADQFREAVKVAIAAGLSDAAVNYRIRKVTKSVADQLWTRRRAQRAATFAKTGWKPPPPEEISRLRPSIDPAKAEQQKQARAEYVRRLHEQSLEQAKQREAQREAGQQLINAGYRAMAAKMHPDAGGSTAAMQVLNAAKNHLKKFA